MNTPWRRIEHAKPSPSTIVFVDNEVAHYVAMIQSGKRVAQISRNEGANSFGGLEGWAAHTMLALAGCPIELLH